jgi:HAD superfamily phosphatase (TIGR01668 family)
MRNWFRPHQVVRRLEELDCAALRERGLRGVLLDLDNTIAPWRCLDVSPAVESWLARLRTHHLRACVVTNAATISRVAPIAERLGLPWVTSAYKPLPHGFRRGMSLIDTAPEHTAMIGDLMTMDIVGGNRLGLYTVLVEPMSYREAWGTRWLQRPLEALIGRKPRYCKLHLPMTESK